MIPAPVIDALIVLLAAAAAAAWTFYALTATGAI